MGKGKYDGDMADHLFRQLTPEEEAEFRQWTRRHHYAETPENFGVMHPVIRDEWRKLDEVIAGRAVIPRCDQCELVSINGVLCHETGCPNSRSRWDRVLECWVKQTECPECGCTVDVGDPCCNAPTLMEDEP